GIGISKWARSRRKKEGHANVHYLRHGRFYIIIANHGEHPFFVAEQKRIRDIRKAPVLFMGYSIGCRRERGGGKDHSSVRISHDGFRQLKEKLKPTVLRVSAEALRAELQTLPFEPYAPVRDQLRGILRWANHRRKIAGLELIPFDAIRLRRAPVLPFD